MKTEMAESASTASGMFTVRVFVNRRTRKARIIFGLNDAQTAMDVDTAKQLVGMLRTAIDSAVSQIRVSLETGESD